MKRKRNIEFSIVNLIGGVISGADYRALSEARRQQLIREMLKGGKLDYDKLADFNCDHSEGLVGGAAGIYTGKELAEGYPTLLKRMGVTEDEIDILTRGPKGACFSDADADEDYDEVWAMVYDQSADFDGITVYITSCDADGGTMLVDEFWIGDTYVSLQDMARDEAYRLEATAKEFSV